MIINGVAFISRFKYLVRSQTAELGTAAPDILFAENFCAPELRNTFHALKIGSLELERKP